MHTTPLQGSCYSERSLYGTSTNGSLHAQDAKEVMDCVHQFYCVSQMVGMSLPSHSTHFCEMWNSGLPFWVICIDYLASGAAQSSALEMWLML